MNSLALVRSSKHKLLLLSKELRFDKRNIVDLHRIALYGSLIELAHALLVLIDNNTRAAVPSVFRTLLETAVELRNLTLDPGYIDNIVAASEQQALRLFREAKKGTNPYLTDLSQDSQLDEHVRRSEAKLAKLKSNGKTQLSVAERFRCAGMNDMYLSVYNDLCCDAHSNSRALISRHIELGSSDFAIVYFKGDPAETLPPELDSAARLLLEAAITMHEFYARATLPRVKELHQDLISALEL